MTDAPTARFFRLKRDTLYHTAGTILSLTPDQVSAAHHELLTLPMAQPEGIDDIRSDVEDLKSGLAALGSHLDDLGSSFANAPEEQAKTVAGLRELVETATGVVQMLNQRVVEHNQRIASLEAAQVPVTDQPAENVTAPSA